MVYVKHGLLRRVILAVLFSGFFVHVQAGTPPDIPKGIAWLQSQVQGNGTLSGESLSTAVPLQARSESLLTLKLLASIPSPLTGAISADAPINTELMARQAIAMQLAGQSVDAMIAALVAQQNADGGFGGDAGFASNPLDTAWILLALVQNNQMNSAAAVSARAFLVAAVQGDGGMAGLTGADRTQNSALALLALQASQTDVAVATVVRNLTTWLQQRQAIDGGWFSDQYLSAAVCWAVSPVISDAAFRTNAAGYVGSFQAADGSWGKDPFVTAVALRALSLLAAPAVGQPGTLSGQVIDANSGTALAGISVNITGPVGLTQPTAVDGRFAFNNLSAGTYGMQISSPGYQSFSGSYTLLAGQSVNAGAIALKPVTGSGMVRGHIVDGVSNTPLASVTVALSTGASTQTDANGNFQMVGLPAGTVTLTASLAGYTSVAGSGTVVLGQALFFSPSLYAVGATGVPTTGQISGQVVAMSSATPLAGVIILSNGVAIGSTAADGSFALTLAPAAYNLRFSLAGYSDASVATVLTAGAKQNANVALAPQLSATTIRGTVSDASTSRPIAGAHVQLIGGASVTTAADGSYSLPNLSGLVFDLRASATGYTGQTVETRTSQPTVITQNFALAVQTGASLDLGPLTVNPTSAGSVTDLNVSTVVSNNSAASASAVILMQVLSPQGKVIGNGSAYDATGTHQIGQFQLGAGLQLPVVLRWNTGQFAPGSYTLVARLVAPGTITSSNPTGTVLVERQGTASITSSAHFSGAVTANPPVVRAGTNTPVQLSALLRNDGNTTMPAQSYQLQITNMTTNAVVNTQLVSGNAFASGQLQLVNFANWTPVDGADYNVVVTAAQQPSLGSISTVVHVGIAATATYTVDKSTVPTGTQAVRGTVHITGQNPLNATLSDPLLSAIHTSIQKAVTYTDLTASTFTIGHHCTACHMQSQALVGGELTKQIATYDSGQRNTIRNVLAFSLQSNGALDGYGIFQQTQSMLGLWGLSTIKDKTGILSTLVSAANYLVDIQDPTGGWNGDRGTADGWWWGAPAHTPFNVKSLVAVSKGLTQSPTGTASTYLLAPWRGGIRPGGANNNSISDASGNVYTVSKELGELRRWDANGQSQLLASDIGHPNDLVMTPDGSIYIASDTGLIHRKPDGTYANLSTIGWSMAGVALGPDGNIYASGRNTIWRITPQDVVTPYLTGPGLQSPQGIAFTAAGDLLVANPESWQIVKYHADGTYDVVVPLIRSPYYIKQNGADFIVSGAEGLYRFNSDWTGERLFFDSTYGINITPTNEILVGYGANLLKLTKAIVDVPTEQAKLATAIARGTNWLLNDSNYDYSITMLLAQRLIGLGSARTYYDGQPIASTIDAKMRALDVLLRARQNVDGGWGARLNQVSDSMVTAQVGSALDTLNPPATDPSIRSAVQWLLNGQGPDGSWNSQNGVMTTSIAATTWVDIWLPAALDRLGGIDTTLSLTVASNVQLDNPSLAPSSTQIGANGATTYQWSLTSVKDVGQDIGFDLSLQSMLPGEQRAMATDAHLTFNNTFTQQPVSAPIDIPTVTASAFLGFGLTTDKLSYPSDTLVNIIAQVNNTGGTLSSGNVKFEIFAPDNSLVATVGTQPFNGLATGTSTNVGVTWSTGKIPTASGYYVKGTLIDSGGQIVSTATANFAIQGSQNQANSARITSDRASYTAAQSVQLTAIVSNTTANSVQSNLMARTMVVSSGAQTVFSQSETIAQLAAGAQRQYSYNVAASGLQVGSYSATLQLLDAQSAVLAQSTSSFSVTSSSQSGVGVNGTLQATPAAVTIGQSVVLALSATNNGNAALVNAPITVKVIDPVAGTVLGTFTNTSNLLPNWAVGATQNLQWTWVANGASGQTVLAAATVQVGGNTVALGQANINVLQPAGPALVGTIAATPTPVVAGSTVTINASALNQGGVDLSNVALTVSLTNTATHAVVATWPYTATIAKGKSFAMLSSWKATGSAPSNTYIAMLNATVAGQPVLLASSNLVVTVPPVKLTVTQSALRQGRMLVLLTCRNGEDHYSEQHGNDVRNNSRGDDDDHCNSNRVTYLNTLLASASIPHLVTSDVDDFVNAMRSGQYNVYWLAGGADKLGNDLAAELREAINRGDGLLLDGIHDDCDNLLDEVVGLQYRGQLEAVNQPILFTMAPLTGKTLQTTGRSNKLRIGNGTLVAKFPAGLACHDCDDDDDRHGTSKTDNTAIAGYVYGKGKGVVMAFDLIGSIQNHSSDPNWITAIQLAYDFLTPEPLTGYTSGAYTAVRTSVVNTGPTVDLNVTQKLPTGAKALSGEPTTTVSTNGLQAQWNFNLPSGQSKDLTLYLRLPAASSAYVIDTPISSLLNGQSTLYGDYTLPLLVISATEAVATTKLIADLKAVSLSSNHDRQMRDQAVKAMQDAVAQSHADSAIRYLLDALGKLSAIMAKDMSSYRLSIDLWMQELAFKWQAAQPVKPAH